jgi:hypothetical protein
VGIVMSLKESFRLLILKYRDKIQRLNGSCARVKCDLRLIRVLCRADETELTPKF